MKIALAFRSKTCLAIMTFFAVHIPQVRDLIPAKYQPFVDVVLAIAACYFRMNPSQTLNNSIEVVNGQI